MSEYKKIDKRKLTKEEKADYDMRERHRTRAGNVKRLSKAQERFVQELAKGTNQTESYRRAYPRSRNWKAGSVQSNAYQLAKHPVIIDRYNEIMAEFRQEESEATLWTRDEAISTLKFVIDTNKNDLERIHEAFEDELSFLANQIKDDPENALNYVQAQLKQRKNRRVSQTHNKGITDAVTELNKMQGFNEENINMNNTVMFIGEDEILD